jgi:hypothetical protein
LQAIEGFAFADCFSLKSICLPASLEEAEGQSFCDCGLTRISFEEGNKHFRIVGDFVVDFEGVRIVRYFGRDCEVRIPAGIKRLGIFCFAECDALLSIDFGPDSSVSLIYDGAFRECSKLSSICIPSSVTSLVALCFHYCDALRSVTFGCDSRLQNIGYGVFWSCVSLVSIAIPSSVEVLDAKSFMCCTKLQSITFAPDSKLTRLEALAFFACPALKAFRLPSSVESVGPDCFHDCGRFFKLSFVAPSRVREMSLDFPLDTTDIPDSVEKLTAWIALPHATRRLWNFGAESKLNQIEVYGGCSRGSDRCFLRFSSRTLKIFRSEEEFGRSNR